MSRARAIIRASKVAPRVRELAKCGSAFMSRRRFVFTLCMEIRSQRATQVMRFEIMRIATISYSTYEMLFEWLMKVLVLRIAFIYIYLNTSLYNVCDNLALNDMDVFKIFTILPYS